MLIQHVSEVEFVRSDHQKDGRVSSLFESDLAVLQAPTQYVIYQCCSLQILKDTPSILAGFYRYVPQ